MIRRIRNLRDVVRALHAVPSLIEASAALERRAQKIEDDIVGLEGEIDDLDAVAREFYTGADTRTRASGEPR